MNIRFNVRLPNTDKFDGAKYVGAMARMQLEKTIPDLKRYFQMTVEGWENKPDFDYKQSLTASSLSMSVFATGAHAAQYALVSHGARPHIIRPKNKTWLRFQTGYSASTRRGFLGSSANRRFGKYVQAEGVNHPGFEGRDFPATIREVFQPLFQADMASAMNL